jgi:hypothetical protein
MRTARALQLCVMALTLAAGCSEEEDPAPLQDGGAGGGSVPASGSPTSSAHDAGAASPTPPALSVDAGVSLACAGEFATCVLADVGGADACLDDYASCEPGLRGDGGLDGTCAVHFSACVLGDPLEFERCFPLLIDCD